MIFGILSELETNVEQGTEVEQNDLMAIKSLKQIFSQIDLKSERIVLEDYERLRRLTERIKGEVLTGKEMEILAKISG